MLHEQNVTPQPHQRVIVEPLFFRERLIAFSELLHISYTKTTILIKGPFGFGTPCGSLESTQQRRGSDAAALRGRIYILYYFRTLSWPMAVFSSMEKKYSQHTLYKDIFKNKSR
jgi:hypothetical protein